MVASGDLGSCSNDSNFGSGHPFGNGHWKRHQD